MVLLSSMVVTHLLATIPPKHTSGVLLTCGANSELSPCLGHDDVAALAVPTAVPSLLAVKVSSVSAGMGHTLVLSAAGAVYSCGRSSH